ncbi:carcinoembryonic antigen-related cell adhesion molecule 6-like [Acipenser ruthenus]|uniref:carcinoembryonic antigen-related cell adhesion molecule 6-like n=1 Tax=Acipenser ruthenus TaxID=7906 RepID=UPI001560CB94|nr:carcinoembryonic antigen-related cell adhesion molecule 6-like [Acipenser ruthenus]XP_034768523.2 carcinoembryonic antigen-related cell adhesion molecule 6-like [Acipenser ruthenus]
MSPSRTRNPVSLWLLCSALWMIGGSVSVKVTAERPQVFARVGDAVSLGVRITMSSPVDSPQSVMWSVKQGTDTRRVLRYDLNGGPPVPLPQYQGRAHYFNGSLELCNLSLSDAGLYKVVVSDMKGAEVQTEVTLTVEVPVSVPSITRHTRPQDPMHSLVLSCSALQGTSLNFSWYQNGSLIHNSPNLSLSNPGPPHCTVYTCVVSNAVSAEEAAFGDIPLCAESNNSKLLLIAVPCSAAILIVVVILAFIAHKSQQRCGKKADAEQSDSIYEPMYPSLRRPGAHAVVEQPQRTQQQQSRTTQLQLATEYKPSRQMERASKQEKLKSSHSP